MNYREAYAKLEAADQLHVLKYYEELSEVEKEALLAQVEATDFRCLQKGIPGSGKGCDYPACSHGIV